MLYLMTFLEGVASFISPCVLPLLPAYLSYFAADGGGARGALVRSLCFVVGFTIVFSLLGVFASTIGAMLAAYRVWVNLVCGVLVVLFGLVYLDVIRLPFLKGVGSSHRRSGKAGALVFGVVYAFGLTPCIGAFLGSALMLAATSAGAAQGALMLVVYSLGLGVPFLLCAALLGKVNTDFRFVKQHYNVIVKVCGALLIASGILMATGLLDALVGLFT